MENSIPAHSDSGGEASKKVQPWRDHWQPKPPTKDTCVGYAEVEGQEIIRDGGGNAPFLSLERAGEDASAKVGEGNKLCPSLGPITNPTLPAAEKLGKQL